MIPATPRGTLVYPMFDAKTKRRFNRPLLSNLELTDWLSNPSDGAVLWHVGANV
jgi:hypothetical protein